MSGMSGIGGRNSVRKSLSNAQGSSEEPIQIYPKNAVISKVATLKLKAVDELVTWSATESVKPTIKAIRDRISQVSNEELSRTLGKRLSHLGEEDRRSLEKMVDSMVAKILHPTMTELREGSVTGDIDGLVGAARRLYGLEQDKTPDRAPVVDPALKTEEG